MGVARCAQIVAAFACRQARRRRLISQACSANQRQALCMLDGQPGAVEAAACQSPALLVVGEVVGLAPGWAGFAGQGDGRSAPQAAAARPAVPSSGAGPRAATAR